MERIISEGIIYKLTKYTDNSAIASGYSYDFGKLKLFIPKAYTNKGGIQAMIPGEIDFLKKDTSDLNKFYSFRVNPEYTDYPANPKISLRLSLYFDIFDKFYDIDQKDSVIWTIIQKYKTLDYSKINIFGIYALLKNSGHMFNFHTCSSCGSNITDKAMLYMGQYLCSNCFVDNGYKTGAYINTVLRSLSKKQLYQNLKVSLYDELSILDLFIYHIESIIEKELKSYKLFKELITTI